MVNNRLQLLFFVLFILVVVGINFFIFLPYLTVLFLAFVFAVIFAPLHNYILKFFSRSPTFSALLTTVLVLVIIMGPVFFFGTILIQETSQVYESIKDTQSIDSGTARALSSANSFLSNFFPNTEISSLKLDLETFVGKGLSWIISHTSSIFSGAIKVFFSLLLMFLSLFYFFKDGRKFTDSLIELSPLHDNYDKKIVDKMILAVNSVVRGHLVIGVIQGILTGIGFYLFGIPSPVLWGTLAAVASLIPSIGTSLVIVPGILFLFYSGSMSSALGLLIWGGVAVGLIDNLLGPVLIKRGIHIHPLLILLSALGGVAFFGPIGFLAGPVALALLFALLDIYPDIVKGRKSVS